MRVIFFPIIFWLRKSTKIKDFQNRKPRPKIKINTLLVLIITSISSLAYSKEYTEILIDAKTGNILHQYNALAFNYPASLTKLMTLYLTFESLNNGKLSLDHELTISRRAAKQPRSNIRLKENETITFIFPSQLAYGYYGDNNKIGSNTPLIYEVTVQKILQNQ